MRSQCTLAVILAACAALLTGCGAEVLTVAATQAELQKEAAQSATRQMRQAGATTGRIQAERAIQTYYAEKGQYPPSLEALVPNYMSGVPTRADGSPWGYDPRTGKLTDARGGPQAQGPTGEDIRNMERIRQAINQYGQATGYYPGTLQALVPYYLTEVPRTQGGQEFIYNPSNGDLRVPGPAGPAGPVQGGTPSRGAGGSGLGPMGEAMTGIGIQQQLGNQSNAGANAAGGYGRRGINGATSEHDRQQQRALGYVE